MTSYKVCVVPSCNKDSISHPEKLFLSVPRNPEKRDEWAKAIKVDYIPINGIYCICEDHFNLSEDTTNWLYCVMIGARRVTLKPDTVPHKFISSPPKNDMGSQLLEARTRHLSEVYEETPSTSNPIRKRGRKRNRYAINVLESTDENKLDSQSVGIMTDIIPKAKKHVCIQVDLRDSTRSIGINTIQVETTDLSPSESSSQGTSTTTVVSSPLTLEDAVRAQKLIFEEFKQNLLLS